MNYFNSRKDNNEALFLNNKGNRLQAGGVRYIFHSLKNKTGVENIHPHKFRRTLATDLLNAGMPIQNVSIILGHSNVKITQEYYYYTNEKIKQDFCKYMK